MSGIEVAVKAAQDAGGCLACNANLDTSNGHLRGTVIEISLRGASVRVCAACAETLQRLLYECWASATDPTPFLVTSPPFPVSHAPGRAERRAQAAEDRRAARGALRAKRRT